MKPMKKYNIVCTQIFNKNTFAFVDKHKRYFFLTLNNQRRYHFDSLPDLLLSVSATDLSELGITSSIFPFKLVHSFESKEKLAIRFPEYFI